MLKLVQHRVSCNFPFTHIQGLFNNFSDLFNNLTFVFFFGSKSVRKAG